MNLDEDSIREALTSSQVPDHMHEGMIMYLLHGIIPGDFLTAVLENNLMAACGRADAENQHRLFFYAMFLHNYVPRSAYGSPKKVTEWSEKRG